MGEGGVEENQKTVNTAQKQFWQAVYGVADKYDLSDIKVSDKYTLLCTMAGKLEDADVHCYKNRLYVVDLKKLTLRIPEYRGRFGLFYQYCVNDIEEIYTYVDDNTIQTCAVYGIEKKEILDGIQRYKVRGIDRIVTFGHTLDLGMVWDGYDVVDMLSRCIICN